MTLDEYLANIPANRIDRFQAIRSLIKSLYPDATESMRYKMPTYEFKDGWIALGNQKSYVSVYTCGLQHLEAFKAMYPKIKCGKGCINLKDKDQFDIADLRCVIDSAMRQPAH